VLTSSSASQSLGTNLLTLGYTSESSVNSATGVNGMFQLDPLDRVYPVFGDSSLRFAAAQANSRVYGGSTMEKSYLLFEIFPVIPPISTARTFLILTAT